MLPVNVPADSFDIFKSDSLTNGSRFAFVPSANDSTIIAIDTRKNIIADVIKLPHVPGAIAVSDKLDLLFVTDLENKSVSVVYLGSKEIVKQLNLGMRPDAILVNPFDRYIAFGSRDGDVSIWDMQTFKEMLRINGLDSAENITFGFDGRNLYVVEQRYKKISVIEMHAREKVAEIELGGSPDINAEISAISRSADGYTGFVSITSEDRVVVIDLIKWQVKRSIPVGKAPMRPYSTADNRYVLVPLRDDKSLVVLSALSYEVITTIQTGVRARELNTGWLDTVAFIMPAEGNEIAVIDLIKLRYAGNIKLSGRTDDGLVTSDSKKLFASIVDNGVIAVIDTRTRTLIEMIQTPTSKLNGIEIAVSNNLCH